MLRGNVLQNIMDINQKINVFSKLGEKLDTLSQEELDNLFFEARAKNSWFTRESIESALEGLVHLLEPDALANWINKYDLKNQRKKVGIVMAGNIPAVGFHDFLCVLLSGNSAVIKLSSQDEAMMGFIFSELLKIEPSFQSQIVVAQQLKDIDAVIATGSDNTSRYFNYYFSKYPNIIRKNRTSCAVFKGDETPEQFQQLGYDIFKYYGLGCRNISKLYVPKGYKFDSFYEGIEVHKTVKDHHKYNNNYDYNKSIYLVNKEPHFDNGFLLLRQSEQFVSPISVLFYEEYDNQEQLESLISDQQDKIQCLISANKWWADSIEPGEAQKPSIEDYADNVDTMKFLTEL